MLDNKINQEGKRRVGVYIRVSTTEQRIDGYGLEAQRTRLTQHIEGNLALNMSLANVYSDTHTGSDLSRDGLQKLMDDVRAKKLDAVLVWKIDRLSRSLKHLLMVFEEFEKNNVSFISLQENIDFRGPIGKLIFQIFGAIAQFERELIKGRTQMGRIASAEMGNYTGTSIPYGYEPIVNKGGRGKTLRIIPDEQKWVRQIFEWYIYEDLGFGQIASKLNESKVARGKHSTARHAFSTWTAKMIQGMIENPMYHGLFVANTCDDLGIKLPEKQWTTVKVPACISEFTFQQAQIARKGRTGGSTDTDYLLSGKLRDMNLEPSKAFVGARRTKGGFSYRRKQFKNSEGVHQPVFEIPGRQMEEYVWGKIMEALKDPEIFVKHYLSKKYADPTKREKLERELENLRSRLAGLNLEIMRIEDAYERGSYDEEKMTEKVTAKNIEIGQIEGKIQSIEDEMRIISSVDIEVEKLKDASEQVRYRLDKLDRRQKKILCNLFIDRVEMRRRRENEKWLVSAEIYFRFNPAKFSETIKRDSTSKDLRKANTAGLKDKKKIDGGPGWS
jgi:DNA invertase Pin-like site-specific DNA recombinase